MSDTTELCVLISEADQEFRILQEMVAKQKIFDIEEQSDKVESKLWQLTEYFGYHVSYEREFLTIKAKYVSITDIKVK